MVIDVYGGVGSPRRPTNGTTPVVRISKVGLLQSVKFQKTRSPRWCWCANHATKAKHPKFGKKIAKVANFLHTQIHTGTRTNAPVEVVVVCANFFLRSHTDAIRHEMGRRGQIRWNLLEAQVLNVHKSSHTHSRTHVCCQLEDLIAVRTPSLNRAIPCASSFFLRPEEAART